jgi:hypothetical protein
MKPCPFCGSDNIKQQEGYGGPNAHTQLFAIVCQNCGCMSSWCMVKEHAAIRWDTRVTQPDEIKEVVQRCRYSALRLHRDAMCASAIQRDGKTVLNLHTGTVVNEENIDRIIDKLNRIALKNGGDEG